MAAVTFQSPRDSMHSYRSEMSKARPKHTLFGTPLEALTDGERAHINSIDVKKYTKVNPMLENTEFSSQLQNYENQKLRVRQAAADEEAAKIKALNFLTTPPAPTEQKHRKPHDSQNLMELMNPRPQQISQPLNHNRYQIMGDVFSSGKDFSAKERSSRDHSVRYGRRSNATNKGFTRDFLEHHTAFNTNQNCDTEYPVDESKPKSTVHLPPNIRHSFGSRLCDELLSDVQEVGRTVDQQQEEKKPRAMPHMDSSMKIQSPLSDYEDLGYNTRLNVFPGLSSKVKTSVTKSNYSDQVFLNRVPDPDQYRMKRDELSAWSEHNLLREKQKTKWKEYEDSLPKQEVNWDRNATRPPAQPKPTPKPVAKKKQRPLKKEKNNEPQAPEEDEFVFKTPPLTPPPALPSLAELPESFQRDDDFWEFFDQEIPRH